MMTQTIANKRRELHQLQQRLISEFLREEASKRGNDNATRGPSLRAIIDTKRRELEVLEKRPTACPTASHNELDHAWLANSLVEVDQQYSSDAAEAAELLRENLRRMFDALAAGGWKR